jgi:predicted enzyme related to lactoylglutathione lyase
MLRGFATLNVYAEDVQEAAAWYTKVFGIPPYYEVPGGYVEFRVGDDEDEFGIINRAYAPAGATDGPAGQIMHWHTDDLEDTLSRLLELGASQYQPPTPHGDGDFVTAAVIDPFGNILGFMYNPHYVDLHSVELHSVELHSVDLGNAHTQEGRDGA